MSEDLKTTKVNPYDLNSVKQVLDDHARKVILDEFPEDVHSSNRKLLLGTFACSLAILSHFAPVPFPKNIPLLIVCAVLYFVCSSILQYIAKNFDQDLILTTKLHLGTAVQVQSQLNPKEDSTDVIYWIKLSNPAGGENYVELKKSVVEYFNSRGDFYAPLFESEIENLLTKFKQSKKKSH